jgi:hypothetical protein
LSASAERRIPRLDGDVFRFGTAMVVLLLSAVFGPAPSAFAARLKESRAYRGSRW